MASDPVLSRPQQLQFLQAEIRSAEENAARNSDSMAVSVFRWRAATLRAIAQALQEEEPAWATSRQDLVDRYLAEWNAVEDGDNYSLTDLLNDHERLVRRATSDAVLVPRLRELAEHWKAQAKTMADTTRSYDLANGMMNCANELDALLAARVREGA